MRFIALALTFGLMACTQLPDITPTNRVAPVSDAYPELIPLSPVLARVDDRAADVVEEDLAKTLTDRADALQRRRPSLGQGAPISSDIAELRARAAILRGDASDIDALRAELAAR